MRLGNFLNRKLVIEGAFDGYFHMGTIIIHAYPFHIGNGQRMRRNHMAKCILIQKKETENAGVPHCERK